MAHRLIKIASYTLILLASVCVASPSTVAKRPADFVDVNNFEPGMVMDIRYYSDYNFVGEAITGYNAPKCLLTRRAAKALRTVKQAVAQDGYNLKIYDCYRPQSAVDHFIRWANDREDTRMKAVFYPFVAKGELFEKGYIAAQSSHSRGSTVDMTLTDKEGNDVDMGYPYDFFDPFSHTDNPDVGEQAVTHRQYLKRVMENHGFINLPEEWWHFTLRDEPYPETYFDFLVE